MAFVLKWSLSTGLTVWWKMLHYSKTLYCRILGQIIDYRKLYCICDQCIILFSGESTHSHCIIGYIPESYCIEGFSLFLICCLHIFFSSYHSIVVVVVFSCCVLGNYLQNVAKWVLLFVLDVRGSNDMCVSEKVLLWWIKC